MNVLLFPKTVVADIRARFTMQGILIRVTRRQRTRVYRVSFSRYERMRRVLQAHPHLAKGSNFDRLFYYARLSCVAGIRETRGWLQQQRPFV